MNRRRTISMMLFTVAAACGLLAPGCVVHSDAATVAGSGHATTRTREVGAFERIVLDGAAKLDVRIGSPQSVSIEADDNVVDLIGTEIRGTSLRIFAKQPYNSQTDVRVTITVPALTGLEVGGSCTARLAGIAAPKFDVEIAGAGDVQASGTTDDLTVRVSGSGKIDLQQLQAKRAEVDVSGAGKVKITATERLDAKVSGVGDVRYAGNPPDVRRKVHGIGRIEPL